MGAVMISRAYNVKMVADMLGISPHTLRAWERRYSAITPERNPKGRRMYAQQEVERLRLLVLLIQQGHHIGGVARLPDSELTRLLQKSQTLINESDKALRVEDEQEASTDAAAEKHINYLLTAVSNYAIGDLAQELEWARLSLSARDLLVRIVAPLLNRVGEMVAQGKLSMAQEHVLSSIIRDHIGQILSTIPHHRRPSLLREQESFLFTTPEGDRHEFGILIGAVLCAHHGIPGHYLGPSLPPEPLLEAIRALHSKIVVLGNSPLPEGHRVLTLTQFIHVLDRGLAEGVEIWIGGAGEKPVLTDLSPRRTVRYFSSIEDFEQAILQRNQKKALDR
jgi:DNA-binding transcriptional MerR regulator